MTQMDFMFSWVVWAGLVGVSGLVVAWAFGLFDGGDWDDQ